MVYLNDLFTGRGRDYKTILLLRRIFELTRQGQTYFYINEFKDLMSIQVARKRVEELIKLGFPFKKIKSYPVFFEVLNLKSTSRFLQACELEQGKCSDKI
jgi:hypothetical protein